jgi:hypothetical protein
MNKPLLDFVIGRLAHANLVLALRQDFLANQLINSTLENVVNNGHYTYEEVNTLMQIDRIDSKGGD